MIYHNNFTCLAPMSHLLQPSKKELKKISFKSLCCFMSYGNTKATHILHGPMLNGSSVAATSQVHTSVTLLLCTYCRLSKHTAFGWPPVA